MEEDEPFVALTEDEMDETDEDDDDTDVADAAEEDVDADGFALFARVDCVVVDSLDVVCVLPFGCTGGIVDLLFAAELVELFDFDGSI